MTDLEIILSELEKINDPIDGVYYILFVILLVIGIVAYRVLITLSESKVKSLFNRSLEEFKSGLYDNLAKSILESHSELKKDILRVQSELNLLLDFESKDLIDVKNALLKVYSSSSVFLTSMDSSSISFSIYKEEEKTEKSFYQIESNFREFQYDISCLEVLTDDELLLKNIHELNLEMVKLMSFLEVERYKFRSKITTYKKIIADGQVESFQEANNRLIDEYKRFNKEFMGMYKPVFDKKKEVRKHIRNRLKSIKEQIVNRQI